MEVYILSGFLGAGKTTLLKNILLEEKNKGRKIGVVMNELGKVSIDSDAVADDIPLRELLDGCVCCTIQGKLEAHLQGIIQQHDLDAIYIETTGVAHPIDVLDACLSPLFADQLSIGAIVTLIDAARWKDRHQLSVQLKSLLIEQVKHGDVLLVNKIDQLSETEQSNIVIEIQSLNPKAKMILTQFAKVGLKDFQTVVHKEKDEHVKVHAANHLHMKTYVHTFLNPIDLEAFEEFLRKMPETIFRIKGYLRFSHTGDTLSFQYSYGMPIYMKEPLKMKKTLVFIGKNLDQEWLEKELTQLELSGV